MLKSGHNFHSKAGFTGSAGKNIRPHIPGMKQGGAVNAEGSKEHFGKLHGPVRYDDHGYQHHCHGGMVK